MLGGLKVAIEYFSNRVKIQALKTNTVVAKNLDAVFSHKQKQIPIPIIH